MSQGDSLENLNCRCCSRRGVTRSHSRSKQVRFHPLSERANFWNSLENLRNKIVLFVKAFQSSCSFYSKLCQMERCNMTSWDLVLWDTYFKDIRCFIISQLNLNLKKPSIMICTNTGSENKVSFYWQQNRFSMSFLWNLSGKGRHQNPLMKPECN